MSEATQVEVNAFLDRDDTLYLSRVKAKGVANSDSVTLRGPVSAIDEPEITVLGLTVDTSTSDFSNRDGPIDRPTFFAAVNEGSQVKIQQSAFDAKTAPWRVAYTTSGSRA